MYDIIIIGGGTAGLTAAVYARRSGRTVLVLEKESFGGQIAYSERVENYPGIPLISGAEFTDRLLEQAMSLGAEIDLSCVTGLSRDGDTWAVRTDDGDRMCKAVIFAAGMKRRRLNVAGESELAGSGVSYCAICDGAFYKGGTVAVIGGGNTAVQDAIHLCSLCDKVYLIHRRGELRADDTNTCRLRSKENVDILLSHTVKEIIGEEYVKSIRLLDGISGEERVLPVDGVFISVGRIPNTEALAGIVSMDEQGFIIAGEDCVTSEKGLFAAGDCRQKAVRQLATAASDGAVAALAACSYIDG